VISAIYEPDSVYPDVCAAGDYQATLEVMSSMIGSSCPAAEQALPHDDPADELNCEVAPRVPAVRRGLHLGSHHADG